MAKPVRARRTTAIELKKRARSDEGAEEMKRRTQQRTDNELRSSINELRSSINNLIRAQPPAVQDAADSAADSAAESAAESAKDF